jgi:hypothetical protein
MLSVVGKPLAQLSLIESELWIRRTGAAWRTVQLSPSTGASVSVLAEPAIANSRHCWFRLSAHHAIMMCNDREQHRATSKYARVELYLGVIVTAIHRPTSANAALLKSQLKQDLVAIMNKTMTAAPSLNRHTDFGSSPHRRKVSRA